MADGAASPLRVSVVVIAGSSSLLMKAASLSGCHSLTATNISGSW